MGTGEIGVDIEKIEPTHLNIASSVYTVDEITWMNESPLERFHILWTWKESAMKAIGTGMSIEPISFEVLPFSQNKSIPLNGRQLYGKTDKIKDYRYSVCSTQPIEELEWIEWNKDLVKR